MKEHWWKVALALALPAVGGLCALAVTKNVVEKEIPVLQAADKELRAADKEQSKAITNVEKDIITMQASVEALGVRQETLHSLTDTKLDKIFTAVEKGNATP